MAGRDPLMPNAGIVARREYRDRTRSRLYLGSTVVLRCLASLVASAPIAQFRLKVDAGSMNDRYMGIEAPAAAISAPETTQALSFSRSVGTPLASAASSLSRIARRPRPIQEVWM